MARQYGSFLITGTTHDLCFYKMEGKYYVRKKSSLSRKRVMEDAAFQNTRKNAALLGTAARIASGVYRQLPAAARNRELYREMTGKVLHFLREGLTEAAAADRLATLYTARNLPQLNNSSR